MSANITTRKATDWKGAPCTEILVNDRVAARVSRHSIRNNRWVLHTVAREIRGYGQGCTWGTSAKAVAVAIDILNIRLG